MTHKVVVSVDTDQPRALSDIAAQLSDVGLEVEAVLDSISMIVGTCASSTIGLLSEVDGVLEVEPQRTVGVPSPDNAIQGRR